MFFRGTVSPFAFSSSIIKLCLVSICLTPILANALELPIWGKEARAKGYELPPTYGISLNEMHVNQGIMVDDIRLKGLSVPLHTLNFDPWYGLDVGTKRVDLPGDLIEPQADSGVQKTDVRTIKYDVWIFPFLNFYAIGGKMTGYSKTQVKVNPVALDKFAQNIDPLLQPLYKKLKNEMHGQDIAFNFQMDLESIIYGAGIVLAGGYGNVFTLVDASLTRTDLSAIDGQIDALVVSPRLGYNYTNMGVPLKIWVGGMYQNVQQQMHGYIHKLGVNKNITNIVDPDNLGYFAVKQHIESPWNTLLGFEYSFTPKINLLGEAGVGKRRTMMLSMEYRF